MAERVAVYPGSFDPITLGHDDIIRRSLKLADRLIVAVAETSTQTKRPLFELEERVGLIQRIYRDMPQVDVVAFSGLLVDYCAKEGIGNILRGLRTPSDFEFEFQMALTNRALQPDIEVVFVMPAAEFVFLSSSLIKEVIGNGGDASRWLPADVHAAVAAKLAG